MQNVLKRSGGKGIDLFDQHLSQARILLTIIYTAILAVILFLSSSITYSFFSHSLEHRFARFHFAPHVFIEETIIPPKPEEVRQDLFHTLFFVNSILLISASILSYWFASLTLKPIQTSYNRQRRFLSDASHELRTPLSILQINLENEISNPFASETVREQAKNHLEEVKRMGFLVHDLLMLSRLDEKEKTSDPFETLDLFLLIKEVLQRLEPLAKQQNILLIFEPSIKIRSEIFAKKELVIQALTNIIKNGIIYNKPNGKVSLHVQKKGSFLQVIVSDSGIGIQAQDVSKVFDRFYRVDQSRSRQTGGSGLGLSIVQSIMEYLGGTIELESEFGKGSRVVLNFPIHRAS